MKPLMAACLSTSFALTVTLLAQQAAFVRVTEAQARQAVSTAATAANGDIDKFTRQFDAEIKKVNPDYEYNPLNGAVFAVADGPLLIFALGPVNRLRSSVQEAIRKFDPLDKLPWDDGVAVVVFVSQITAPDIIKIVLTRDGKTVEPLRNNLVATEQTTRMGAKTMLHEGPVFFPAEAFDPGAVVVVTAIPENGTNIVKKFTDKELRRIQ